MASASYAQLVARTSSLLHDHEDLKGIISAAKAGDILAVLDRNELQGEWRKARLLRLEDTNEDQHGAAYEYAALFASAQEDERSRRERLAVLRMQHGF